jgi:hypothetical protein
LLKRNLQTIAMLKHWHPIAECLIEKDTVGGETGAAGSSRCLTKGETMANGAMLDERKL